MEKFICIECQQLLEFYKFSNTQQKIARRTNKGKCSSCVVVNERPSRLTGNSTGSSPKNLNLNKRTSNQLKIKEIPRAQFTPHRQIEGLYYIEKYPQEVISKILNELKNVPWKKSLCRSTYSCGWEWINSGGGKLIGWNNPPPQLARAISLLSVPKQGSNVVLFNQIIFTKYHEDSYQCQSCGQMTPAFNFPKDSSQHKICYRCTNGLPTPARYDSNLYEGMASHTDRFELGPVVWGITLLGEGFMRFSQHKPGNQIIDVPASGGSGYLMTENSRYKWKHQPHGQKRISMTIRAVPCESPHLRNLGFSF